MPFQILLVPLTFRPLLPVLAWVPLQLPDSTEVHWYLPRGANHLLLGEVKTPPCHCLCATILKSYMHCVSCSSCHTWTYKMLQHSAFHLPSQIAARRNAGRNLRQRELTFLGSNRDRWEKKKGWRWADRFPLPSSYLRLLKVPLLCSAYPEISVKFTKAPSASQGVLHNSAPPLCGGACSNSHKSQVHANSFSLERRHVQTMMAPRKRNRNLRNHQIITYHPVPYIAYSSTLCWTNPYEVFTISFLASLFETSPFFFLFINFVIFIDL